MITNTVEHTYRKSSYPCIMVNVSPLAKQTWIFTGVLLNMVSLGMNLSFPSIMLPALMAPDSDIKVDLYTASWISSVIGTAGVPGFIFSSIIMELYGRKFAYSLFVVPVIGGWMCIYFGQNVPMLIIGRAMIGMSFAATASIGAVVIGEYMSPKNRGMFLNMKTASICFGNMIVHLLGYFIDWKTVALVAVAPAVISFLNVCSWPESPAWLASTKKFDDCEKSFYWLRGRDPDSIQELREFLIAQKEIVLTKSTSVSLYYQFVEFFEKFKKKDFIKPVFIILLAGMLLESSGRHVFPAYALQIIEEVTGSKTQSFYYILGLDIIITASAIFSSILVKYFKRRTLLFGTGFLALLILFSVCSYLFLASKDIISKERTVIPVALFGLYFIVTNLGCTTITGSLLGELFPLAHRGAGTCVSCVFLAMVLMSSMQITPFLLTNIRVYGTFSVFGTIMLILLIALWFILPETKDKTLQHIENYFNYGRYSMVISDDSVEMALRK